MRDVKALLFVKLIKVGTAKLLFSMTQIKKFVINSDKKKVNEKRQRRKERYDSYKPSFFVETNEDESHFYKYLLIFRILRKLQSMGESEKSTLVPC